MKLALILLISLTISSIKSDSRQEIAPQDVLETRQRGVIKRKKIWRKKYSGAVGTCARVYAKTLKLHVRKSLVTWALVSVSPLTTDGLFAAGAMFVLSSLTTLAQIGACRLRSVWGREVLGFYCEAVNTLYRMMLWSVLWLTLAWYWIVPLVHWLGAKASSTAGMLFYGVTITIGTEGSGEFRENLNWQNKVIIEESERHYRIRIDLLQWTVAKKNVFTRIIFVVLIYAPLVRIGAHQDIDLKTLARALGLDETKFTSLYRWCEHFRKADCDLAVIAHHAIRVQFGVLRKKVMAVLFEDLSMSAQEIKERLQARGICVTIEEIELSLKLADFWNLRKAIHMRYRKKKHDWDYQRLWEVREQGQDYIFRLGEWYWTIGKKDRFLWIALMYMLYQARDIEGRRVFTHDILRGMAVNSKQRLLQLFGQYEILCDRYRDLNWVGEKRADNDRLTDLILDLWLEDITLSADKIAQKLVELGAVQSILPARVRALVSEVNFMQVRRQILKDYKNGDYRKSSQWVMQKYQQIIAELLEHLAQGKTWSRAQIDRYLADLPAPLPTQDIQEQPADGKHRNRAWLKCFLFNLPKSMDSKICCPQCGSFHTSRKSRVPHPHMVKDVQGSQTVCVHTFRFRCNNPLCSKATFTATPDGSHILDEDRFAKACVMLRLVMAMGCSCRAAGRLLGLSASTVFDQLTYIADTISDWESILGVTRFSGTLCIDEKFVKIAEIKKDNRKRPFAYLFFAVDPQSGDLLHIDVFTSRGTESVEAFLTALKVRGIFPQVVMTDLMSAYDKAIANVFGRNVIVAKCHFHFKQNIHKHIQEQFGTKDIPELAEQLRRDIFFIVDHKSKKTIRHWYDELLKLKPRYLQQEPRLEPLFNCLQNYIPHLLRVVENPKVTILTNNAAEQAIRHFNQKYKVSSGFKTLQTCARHARLFQLVYRFSPYSQDADTTKRGRSPLQLAGHDIADMPLFQYLTEPLLFNLEPAKNLALCQQRRA